MVQQRHRELLILCFLLGLALALLQPSARLLPSGLATASVSAPSAGVIQISSHDALDSFFADRAYDLSGIQNDGAVVPALFLTALPTDLHEIDEPKARKDMFIRAVLPLALLVNQHIAEKRAEIERLAALQAENILPTEAEQAWLQTIANEYSVSKIDFAELLRRVDQIPTSLLIAQAAEESGWGTSRFARAGNALFGQQVYNAQNGIRPDDRDAGRKHYVRSFDNLYQTILSYTRNLNSHRAYDDFRTTRAQMRAHYGKLDPLQLANTLVVYSERREAYVRTIKKIIVANDLRDLDRARLAVGNATSWRERFI